MRRKFIFHPTLFFALAICGLVSGQVVINEIDSDTPSTDTLEFIELYDGGSGNTPLDGFVLVLYNGNGDVSYRAFDLDGLATDDAGYFVIGNPDVIQSGLNFPAGTLQNGADAVALYQDDALDFPAGTIVKTENLIDAVVYGTDDPEDEGLLALLNTGQRQADEAGRGDKDGHSLQRFPNGSGGARNTASFAPRIPTPGESNGGETIALEIHDVQGNGLTSPYLDENVLLSQNIVTGVTADGFFIQTPDGRQDDDPETSQGIFIYTESAPAVQPDDQVDVTGMVQEYYGETEILLSEEVDVLSSNHGLPDAIVFDESLPSPDPGWEENALERFEGMRVHVEEGMVCGPSDSYGEAWIVASANRPFREPGILFPGQSGLPVWDGNPERLVLDPDGLGLTVPFLCAGAWIDSLTGILRYRYGNYQIQPTVLSISGNECQASVRARAEGEFTVGTLNLHRLIDDVDDPLTSDGVTSTEVFQRHLKKLSHTICEVMDCPDILAVQEAENLAVLEALAEEIQTDNPDVEYTALLEDGNDVSGIDVGFLMAETIRIDSVVQIGKTDTFDFSGTTYTLHDRPPLVLYFHTGAEEIFRGVVINLHLRSLIGIDDSDSLRVRAKRHAQAVDVAQLIQTLQENDPTIQLAVTGDFNAFEFTDGFVDVLGQFTGNPDPDGALIPCTPIVNPTLSNQVLFISENDRYSYVYQGTAQVLDHVLVSQALKGKVTEVRFGRGNADAPVAFEEDEDSPLRSSDHDGLVMFVLPGNEDDVDNEVAAFPEKIVLYGNYPNPFNPVTQIDFSIPRDGKVDLSIFNILGQHVATIRSGLIQAGFHSLRWEGRDESGREVPSGVYLVYLRTEREMRIRKMVLQR